ncbi:MAG TPA: DUF4337 family protein [Tepidisphaeraceae bacterium]|jgi:hypothetical protein|nr:DUF4337 family protein [Tepidisphaeraceae bacterium]
MSDTNAEAPKSTTWQDWVSRTTAVFAVLAALSSGVWGASNLRAILEQGRVNDQWAYYQSASIKAHGAGQMRDQTKALGTGETAERAKAFNALASELDKEQIRESDKKDKAYHDATEYEKSRDKWVERGFWYEVSFALLQVAVILSTIAAAAKSRGLLITAAAFGVLGLAVLANGYFFIKHAPPSWYESVSKGMASDVK